MKSSAKSSAIRSHPHGPRLTDDGRLLVSPLLPSDHEPSLAQIVNMLAVKLDVLAVGLDALVSVEQLTVERLDLVNERLNLLAAGVGAIGDKLDKLAAKLDGIKLPAFLTPRK